MWQLPGPFAVREPFPDDPPITASAKFARALDVALPHLDAGDELLGAAGRTIGTVTDDGLDGEYFGTIGRADAGVDEQRNAPNDLTADVLTYTGQAVDALRDSTARYLPPASTPIQSDFVEPPAPPTTSAPPAPPAPTDGTDTPQP